MMQRLARPGFLLAIVATALAVACSDSTGSENSPLAGLAPRTASDSIGNPPPPPPTNPAPGGFHGTVIGPSAPGSAGDTLATAPRIAGVFVSAYPVIGGTQADPDLGPVEQTTVTDINGRFALTLSGGTYVVTFNPPTNGIYGGVWVTSTTSATSNDWQWWVVLWKK